MIKGIDLNSRAIALIGITEPWIYEKIEVHGKVTDRAQILGMLHQSALEIIEPGDQVYVEAPILAGMRNIQSTVKIAAAYGAVLSAIDMRRAAAIEVPVSSWKVATVGHGAASKDDVSRWLHRVHPSVHRECSGDQDLMDAACIALYGQRSAQAR